MYPTMNNVFIQQLKKENTSASGIIISKDIETGNKPAYVVAVGPDCRVTVGAKVYVKWADAVPVTHQGVEGAFIKEDQILGYFE